MTFVDSYMGLPEKLKLPNGSILSRDAGNVSFPTHSIRDGEFLGETV